MNKTFQTILSEYPDDVYDVSGVTIDNTTQEILNDWFSDYKISGTSESQFLRYWHRRLRNYYPRYILKLENELIEIPDLTDHATAVHSVLTSTGSNASSQSSTGSSQDSGENSISRTDSSTDGRTVEGSGKKTHQGSDSFNDTKHDESENNKQHSGSNSSSENSDNKHLTLEGAQSAAYGSGGFPGDLDWQYISGQSEDKGSKSGSGQDSSTDSDTMEADGTLAHTGQNSFTDNDSNESEESATHQGTGSETGSHSGTSSSSSTSSIEGTNESQVINDSMHSGRNVVETEIRMKIMEYIDDSNSLQTFLKAMRPCFILVHDLDWEI